MQVDIFYTCISTFTVNISYVSSLTKRCISVPGVPRRMNLTNGTLLKEPGWIQEQKVIEKSLKSAFLLECYHSMAFSCELCLRLQGEMQGAQEDICQSIFAQNFTEYLLQLLITSLCLSHSCVSAAANMPGILSHHSPRLRCHAAVKEKDSRLLSVHLCYCFFLCHYFPHHYRSVLFEPTKMSGSFMVVWFVCI